MPESAQPAPLPRRLAEAGLTHIALVGMPGAGKTSVGRALAALLGLQFIDLDEAIEQASHLSIAQMFAERGEVLFRAQERAVLREVLSLNEPCVLACGGGTWADAAMRRTLSSQTLPVLLRAPTETLLARLESHNERASRPLLGGPDPKAALRKLERERERAHARCPLSVETAEKTVDEVALAIQELCDAPFEPIDLAWVNEPLRAPIKEPTSDTAEARKSAPNGTEGPPESQGLAATASDAEAHVSHADPTEPQRHPTSEAEGTKESVAADVLAAAMAKEGMPPAPEPPSWPELQPLPEDDTPQMAEVAQAVSQYPLAVSEAAGEAADGALSDDDGLWQPYQSAWDVPDSAKDAADTAMLKEAKVAVDGALTADTNLGTPVLPEAVPAPPSSEPPRPLAPALTIQALNHAYPVYLEDRAEGALETVISSLCPTRQMAIICDTHVCSLFVEALVPKLTALGIRVTVHSFVPGEEVKSLKTALALYDALADANLTRHDLVVGLGGGVSLDMAGFVASTYLRGVPLMLVPTSTLAAVDACVGGKNGVNTRRAKNMVGTIYPPRAVFVATEFLATQSRRAHTQGLVEVLKMGALLDPELFDQVASGDLTDLGQFDVRQKMRAVLLRALELKAHIVQADEHEGGRRAILNFGHTVGHAIEAAAGQTISHGEAVGLGMVAEATWAETQGLGHGVAQRLTTALKAMNMPVDWRRAKLNAAALCHDKKRVGDEVTLPVLKALGDVTLCPITLSQLVSYTQPEA